MGIFSFFKKKKEAQTNDTPQATQPNQYGNYLYPPRTLFTVYGMNPKTGRRNKKVYEVTDATAAEAQATSEGLVPPFDTTWEPMSGPTERQEEYARNIGVTIPKGACSIDVSALLTRYEENDPHQATAGFLEYLASKGWRGSVLVGYKNMFKPILAHSYTVPEPLDEREKIALYAYCAVQGMRGESAGNLLTAPGKARYFEFADRVLADEKLLASYRRTSINDYYEPEKRTAIYQATKALV